jgi:hypothetical protein
MLIECRECRNSCFCICSSCCISVFVVVLFLSAFNVSLSPLAESECHVGNVGRVLTVPSARSVAVVVLLLIFEKLTPLRMPLRPDGVICHLHSM